MYETNNFQDFEGGDAIIERFDRDWARLRNNNYRLITDESLRLYRFDLLTTNSIQLSYKLKELYEQD
jgi:hypothetical protein